MAFGAKLLRNFHLCAAFFTLFNKLEKPQRPVVARLIHLQINSAAQSFIQSARASKAGLGLFVSGVWFAGPGRRTARYAVVWKTLLYSIGTEMNLNRTRIHCLSYIFFHRATVIADYSKSDYYCTIQKYW